MYGLYVNNRLIDSFRLKENADKVQKVYIEICKAEPKDIIVKELDETNELFIT
jgi:hypothetical protein